jgi:cystathionine beta-lyase
MGRHLLNLTLGELRRRTSVKWARYPADVLPLWVAEMDVHLAPAVADAITEAVASGDTGYASEGPYAAAVAEFARDRWSWEMDPATARLVPDVMVGISEVLALVTRPGDAVVVNPPVYPPFWDFIRHAGRRVVEAPLSPSGRLGLATLESAFRDARRDGGQAAYLLCSPHNPTGTVHTRAELESVAVLARSHGVRVVTDEIHAPVVPASTCFTPYLTVSGADDAVALLSASKAWNLAGLKAAVAIPGPESVGDLRAMPEIVQHGVSHVACIAHSAALREGRGWLDDLLEDLDRNRTLLTDLVADLLPGVHLVHGEGTYFGWLDFRSSGLGDDPAREILRRSRVALNPGPTFGSEGRGFARLNLATSPDILIEAVRRVAALPLATGD